MDAPDNGTEITMGYWLLDKDWDALDPILALKNLFGEMVKKNAINMDFR